MPVGTLVKMGLQELNALLATRRSTKSIAEAPVRAKELEDVLGAAGRDGDDAWVLLWTRVDDRSSGCLQREGRLLQCCRLGSIAHVSIMVGGHGRCR